MSRLYDRLVYWLHIRRSARRAQLLAKELRKVLDTNAAEVAGSIFAEECWSLICEAEGDFANAIKRREKEIALIRRLHEITKGTECEELALRQYDHADLRDRLNLLATLRHDSGELEKAIETLHEAKQYAEKHGIQFEDEALLNEYVAAIYELGIDPTAIGLPRETEDDGLTTLKFPGVA